MEVHCRIKFTYSVSVSLSSFPKLGLKNHWECSVTCSVTPYVAVPIRNLEYNKLLFMLLRFGRPDMQYAKKEEAALNVET